jgi:hypothetical protein
MGGIKGTHAAPCGSIRVCGGLEGKNSFAWSGLGAGWQESNGWKRGLGGDVMCSGIGEGEEIVT